jgi:hypothetical protein
MPDADDQRNIAVAALRLLAKKPAEPITAPRIYARLVRDGTQIPIASIRAEIATLIGQNVLADATEWENGEPIYQFTQYFFELLAENMRQESDEDSGDDGG